MVGHADTIDAVVSAILRAAVAAALLALLAPTVTSPVVPWWLTALAAGVLGAALWRPAFAILPVVALAPLGERLGAVPVRATEILLFAFFAGWALRLRDRPRVEPVRLAAVLAPALAFAAVVALSWGRLALARVPDGQPWSALSGLSDYLVTAGRDPHTAAAMLLLLGVAVFSAAAGAGPARAGAAAPLDPGRGVVGPGRGRGQRAGRADHVPHDRRLQRGVAVSGGQHPVARLVSPGRRERGRIALHPRGAPLAAVRVCERPGAHVVEGGAWGAGRGPVDERFAGRVGRRGGWRRSLDRGPAVRGERTDGCRRCRFACWESPPWQGW